MRELALHILDLMMNSIEAEASRIILCIEESQKENLLKIRIRDNGKGMSPDTVQKVLDPFMTTRTTRSVGMGLPLMRQAAIESNGDLTIESEIDRGTQLNIQLELGHINRMPLGDIATTLVNLMICSPGIHLFYFHKTDCSKFCFDSFWFCSQMKKTKCTLYELVQPAIAKINTNLRRINSIS